MRRAKAQYRTVAHLWMRELQQYMYADRIIAITGGDHRTLEQLLPSLGPTQDLPRAHLLSLCGAVQRSD